MSGVATAFLVLPSCAAVLVAWLVRDWRVAGLIAASGMALLIVLLALRLPLSVFAMPLLSGAVVGGISTLCLLRLRPESSVWTRMSLALVVAFLAHLFLLSNLSMDAG